MGDGAKRVVVICCLLLARCCHRAMYLSSNPVQRLCQLLREIVKVIPCENNGPRDILPYIWDQ
ncbi:hypothetical protein ROBYS_43490 [Roseobacter sp. OBYS 0001]|nr:hypothetical protein ROBYS_43490 [Roseobacter sp. OBYS 0001]